MSDAGAQLDIFGNELVSSAAADPVTRQDPPAAPPAPVALTLELGPIDTVQRHHGAGGSVIVTTSSMF